MSTDLRRRRPETVSSGDSPSELQDDRDPLVKRGLELYQKAEQDGFQDSPTLVDGLNMFVQAAENGVDEAKDWIGSFLGSLSALPANVVLPDKLVKVMTFVKTATPEEKQVRRTAKSMFHKMAGGKLELGKGQVEEAATQLLTTDPTQSSTGEFTKIAKSQKMLAGSVKRLLEEAAAKSTTDQISEEEFAEVAVEYARGDFMAPNFVIAEELSDEQRQDFQKANLVRKVYEYPWHSVRSLKVYVFKTIERRGVKWVWSSFPTKQFYLLLIAYLLPLLTVNFVVSAIATVIFYSSFIAMVITTLQIVLTTEKSFLMFEYSSIFQYFSDDKIELQPPKSQLIKHAGIPYIAFLISLAVAMITIGLAHLIVNEILSVGCSIIVAGLFLEYELYKSPLALAVILSRSLSWLYVFVDLVQAVLPIPGFIFFASTKLFSIPVIPGVWWIGVNLTSLIQLPMQLAIIGYSLYQYSWRNFITGLGPVMLFVCWSSLCQNFVHMSNLRYLAMAAGGAFLVLASLPFLPIIFVLSPGAFFFYYGATRPFFISLSFVIIISLILLFTALNFKRIKEATWLNIPIEYLLTGQIVMCILFVFIGSMLYSSIHDPGALPVVTPAEYANSCIPFKNGNYNSVMTEISCYHLKDRVFIAEGIIVRVKVSSIVDNGHLSVASLPSPVKTALTCLFGRAKPMCEDNADSPTCIYTGCNFHHTLQYTFDIELQVNMTSEDSFVKTTLLAGNSFQNIVSGLQSGTYLKFNSTFVSGMGSDHLTLQATSLSYNSSLDSGVGVIGHSSTADDDQQQELFAKFLSSLTKTVYLLLEILFGYSSPS